MQEKSLGEGDGAADQRILLNWILWKQVVRMWT